MGEPNKDDDERYVTVRDFLGHFIGQTIIDITQHDEEEFEEDGWSKVYLHMSNGESICFYIGDDGCFAVHTNEDEDEGDDT
jgi:hypothetical protein